MLIFSGALLSAQEEECDTAWQRVVFHAKGQILFLVFTVEMRAGGGPVSVSLY